ncbi:unnamed protein product [Darwinula stevensoni]|uniref:Uncharacterized protein n=1 Tax=Darwinula stevensoni TaxID=69355 RepID=A0A7R8X3S6_9CRUS|nr:unnamed protein product [Darwinula stevensoni]CAG0885313.1 unnamed protein product [Darwinula stevensoni]
MGDASSGSVHMCYNNRDRYGRGNMAPVMDPQQDWEVLWGFENGTHTVLRFRRRLHTCDSHDWTFTGDTVRVLYAYDEEDPTPSGGNLKYHGLFRRGSRSLYLLQRPSKSPQVLPKQSADARTWDLLNNNISLPENKDTLYWCKVFRLPPLGDQKHHLIGYEPLMDEKYPGYMHHVLVYECHGHDKEFQQMEDHTGFQCYQANMPPFLYDCNNVIAAWALGSNGSLGDKREDSVGNVSVTILPDLNEYVNEGFVFPERVGYPLDSGVTRYYLMETHYDNREQDGGIRQTSGLRLFYRAAGEFQSDIQDAGVLSLGIHPNWKHLIPPGQKTVVSQGHCVPACTEEIPSGGISAFAAILHTHLIGEKVSVRQIRGEKELPPIASDDSYDFNYQEYREFSEPRKILPGDHLVTECVYNSHQRGAMTLGGYSTREEMCLAFIYYYPRMDLSICYSLPSLSTVLQSLGIQELVPGSNPIKIKSPGSLSGVTLEERLVSYDWKHDFPKFQNITLKGSFQPMCWAFDRPILTPEKDRKEYNPPVIRVPYKPFDRCESQSLSSHVPLTRHNHHLMPPRKHPPDFELPFIQVSTKNRTFPGPNADVQEGMMDVGTSAASSSRLSAAGTNVRMSLGHWTMCAFFPLLSALLQHFSSDS